MKFLRQPKCKCRKLQKRFILLLISFLLLLGNYSMKHLLLDTRRMFVAEEHLKGHSNHSDVCNVSDRLEAKVDPFFVHRDILERTYEYKRDKTVKKKLDLFFKIGLFVSRFFGGFWSDKRNPKLFVLVCMATQSILVLLTPLVIQNIKGNWRILLGWHMVNGLFQGPVRPAMLSVFGQWIPNGEKTMCIALINSVVYASYATYNILGTTFINVFDHWSADFYFFGCVGVLSSVLWFFFCYSSPESHPTITLAEKSFLRQKLGPYYDNRTKSIPWREMALSVPFWILVLNFMGWQWAWSTVTVEYRRYLRKVLKLDIDQHYLHIIIFPSLCMFITYGTTAALCDILIRREVVDINTMRKIYNNMGSMGTNSFTVAAVYAGCRQVLPAGIYSVVISFMAIYYTGAMVSILDLAPNFGGSLYGFARTVAFVSDYLRSFAFEDLVKDNNISAWKKVFWFTLGACGAVNLSFAMFSKSTPAAWNLPQHLRVKEEIELSA